MEGKKVFYGTLCNSTKYCQNGSRKIPLCPNDSNKYHYMRTVPKSNKHTTETEATSIPVAHMYVTVYLPGLVQILPVKVAGLTYIFLVKSSPLIEMERSCKFCPQVSKYQPWHITG